MRDPFAGYDAWLEAPYQDAIEDSDRFIEWAEEEGYDFDNPEEMKQAEKDYEEFLAAEYEDEMIARYEDAMERRAEEWAEREWDDYDPEW